MSVAPHIFTLTGNLLAERTFEFDSWDPGQTQRARHESFQVGGKGINVSKMLNRLGAANTALCFAGGAAGEECAAWLEAKRFSFRVFTTERSTRVGTVVRGGNHPETTFLGPDVTPSTEAIAACADFLDAQPDGQILACCGSFPGWRGAEFEPLRDVFSRWLHRGVLVADTYGPPLDWFAQRALPLIKINAQEFAMLATESTPFADQTKRSLSRWPVARWVVSDGPRSVVYRDGLDADIGTMTPPPVREVSATGSGDVLFAVLLHSLYIQNQSMREALERALPLAAANAAHAGVAEFPET